MVVIKKIKKKFQGLLIAVFKLSDDFLLFIFDAL